MKLKSIVFSLLTFALTFVFNVSLAQADPAIGKPAPAFEVTDIDGKKVSSAEMKGKIVVLEWFNSGCPFVQRIYKNGQAPKLQAEMLERGVEWVIVNSTAADHKDFLSKEKAEKQLSEWKARSTHYVSDPTGTFGKLYSAKTTPTYFIIGKDGNLAYSGAVDNYPEGDDEPGKMKFYFEDALREVVAGNPVTLSETKSYGCSVKYAE